MVFLNSRHSSAMPALSVAPMMDWTTRHCRFFHRLFSPHILLYTEMIHAGAIVFGDRARFLDFDAGEHPVALQIGGSDLEHVAEATRIGCDWGYDEINLNCGCPSDRVQNGAFGACLMRDGAHVAQLVTAMKHVSCVRVTVKCRLGVDDQPVEETLPAFLKMLVDAGVDGVVIHARKAWLKGLSPRENREVPPLDYSLVYAMKEMFPTLPVSLNGGVGTLDDVCQHLEHVDSVMIGRAAYHDTQLLLGVDHRVFDVAPLRSVEEIFETYVAYVAAHESLFRPQSLLAPVFGFFHGQPRARLARQILSEMGRGGVPAHRVLKSALREIGIVV